MGGRDRECFSSPGDRAGRILVKYKANTGQVPVNHAAKHSTGGTRVGCRIGNWFTDPAARRFVQQGCDREQGDRHVTSRKNLYRKESGGRGGSVSLRQYKRFGSQRGSETERKDKLTEEKSTMRNHLSLGLILSASASSE